MVRFGLLLASCLGAMLAGVTPAAAACAKLVASGNPEYPPYLWPDPADADRLIGANAAFMERLSAKIGLPIEMRYVGSWARVQEEMRAGRIDLIAGAFLTTARLDYMDYFTSTIATTRSVIVTRADSKLNYQAWPDLKGYQGLTVVNNSFGEAFDRFAADNLTIEHVTRLDNALQMLAGKRGDYLIYEDAPVHAFAARAGIKDLREAPEAISNENLYLTFSHRSPCNEGELRGRIARAMRELAEEGVMDPLLAEAIEHWRTQ
jgi:polar amino acid transport system substrate-binding protein